MYVRVDHQLYEYAKAMDSLAARQMPFVTARTLTLTARDARDAVRDGLPQRFTIRSNWVRKGIQFRGATKAIPVAVVGSRDWFMASQEKGGVRRARHSQHLARPVAIRKSKAARITKGKRPRALLNNKGQAGGKRRFFVTTLRKGRNAGKKAVLRRTGRDRFPVQVLYVMEKRQRIVPRFGFHKTVMLTVRRRLSKNFGRVAAGVIKEARRKMRRGF